MSNLPKAQPSKERPIQIAVGQDGDFLELFVLTNFHKIYRREYLGEGRHVWREMHGPWGGIIPLDVPFRRTSDDDIAGVRAQGDDGK